MASYFQFPNVLPTTTTTTYAAPQQIFSTIPSTSYMASYPCVPTVVNAPVLQTFGQTFTTHAPYFQESDAANYSDQMHSSPPRQNWLRTTFDSWPPKGYKPAEVVSQPTEAVAQPDEAKAAPQVEKVKIIYFDLKARALFPLLVAEVGGIPYEWHRVAMEDWPELKQNTPFGQLPVLEHGDIVLAHSSAIASYIGRLAGLLGKEDADFAMSQMLVGQYEDMLASMARNYYSANKAEDMEKYFAEKLPSDLAKVEKFVAGGFTNDRTIGELAIFAFINILKDMQPDCVDAFPALTAFYTHLANDPKVSAFLAGNVGEVWYKKDW